MHYLHKILVYIPEITDTPNEMSRENLLKEIRSHADSTTEDFYPHVFDWRETDSAGRWTFEYPRQVYLAAEDTEWFIKELQWVMDAQHGEIDMCMAQIKASVGTNLEDIINGIWDRDLYDETKNGFCLMTPFYLYNIACHLHGDYRCDSYFYNTHQHTARIYKSDIEKVKQDPEKWALVMFDYHN